MANFTPQWDINTNKPIIIEGEDSLNTVTISKYDKNDMANFTYELGSNFELVMTYTIQYLGSTIDDDDVTITVGLDPNNLVPISEYDTNEPFVQGQHTAKLGKSYTVVDNNHSLPAFYINIHANDDGIWDAAESVSIKIDSIRAIEYRDQLIIGDNPSGILVNSQVVVQISDTNEIWLTPDLVTHGTTLYSIGSIDYGVESRMFVMAYGRRQPNRVFVPAYRVIDASGVPTTHVTGRGTETKSEGVRILNTEEERVLVKDETGNYIKSGLVFCSNGQFLQSFNYETDLPYDMYVTVEIVPPTYYYATPEDAFYVGKRFRAYQRFIAPADVSNIDGEILPNHMYQLRDTSVYPYVVKEITVQGAQKIQFESDRWIDLGVYDASLGASLIGSTRTFRIIINNKSGTNIDFVTPPDLGSIHNGEYFGHSKYPIIVATGGYLMSYTVEPSMSRDNIANYGLSLSADGLMCGKARVPVDEFGAQDSKELRFTVRATSEKGLSQLQEFYLKVINGTYDTVMQATCIPSRMFERKWFSIIASKMFDGLKFYRPSDSRYGLQRLPKILVKENFMNPQQFTNLADIRKQLRNGIITDTDPILQGSFNVSLGNYKVKTAMDNEGNMLYDVLYRELLPVGTIATVDETGFNYTNMDIEELYALRGNIYNIIGEDTKNLLAYTDDYNNRGVIVEKYGYARMVDSVPRYMKHPDTEKGAIAGLSFVIPVAYLEIGEGEKFMQFAASSKQLSQLLNTVFEIQAVEFEYYASTTSGLRQDSFRVELPNPKYNP